MGGGFGALLFLAVLRLVFIRGEGYAGPPYSCLNKSKKRRRRSWLGSVFGVILQQFQSCQITCFSTFIGVQWQATRRVCFSVMVWGMWRRKRGKKPVKREGKSHLFYMQNQCRGRRWCTVT